MPNSSITKCIEDFHFITFKTNPPTGIYNYNNINIPAAAILYDFPSPTIINKNLTHDWFYISISGNYLYL